MISTPSEAEWKHCRKTFNVAFSPAAMRKVSLQTAVWFWHPFSLQTTHCMLCCFKSQEGIDQHLLTTPDPDSMTRTLTVTAACSNHFHRAKSHFPLLHICSHFCRLRVLPTAWLLGAAGFEFAA